jgi:hypothetical protein
LLLLLLLISWSEGRKRYRVGSNYRVRKTNYRVRKAKCRVRKAKYRVRKAKCRVRKR